MLSYLTLHSENWQKHSYIAMNGVYENAVFTALKTIAISVKLYFAQITMQEELMLLNA